MYDTPNTSKSKKPTPATARGDNSSEGTSETGPCANCTVYHGEMNVKEKVPYESLKRGYSSTISGRVLLGLLDYCRDNKISPGRAIVDQVEFRLVQLGYLPEWWFNRKRI